MTTTRRDARVRSLMARGLILFGLLAAATPASALNTIAVDVATGKVLSQHNATQRWYPASTTKLMTAYVTLKALQAGEVALEQGRQAQANAALINAERRVARDVFDQAAQYEAKRSALGKWDGTTPRSFADTAEKANRNFQLGAIPLAIYMQMQQSYIDATNALLDTRREALEALLMLRALNGGTALAR